MSFYASGPRFGLGGRFERTEGELHTGNVLLDALELHGILVGQLDVAKGVLLGLGAGGRAFYAFAAHGCWCREGDG